MNKMNYTCTVALLLSIVLLLNCFSDSSDAGSIDVSIGDIHYEDGVLTASGVVVGDYGSSLQYFVTGNDLLEPYSYVVPASDGSFSIVYPIGIIDDGTYLLNILAKDGSVYSKEFQVQTTVEVTFTLKQNHVIPLNGTVLLTNLIIDVQPIGIASFIEWSVEGHSVEISDGFASAISTGSSVLTGVLNYGNQTIIQNCTITVMEDVVPPEPAGEEYSFFIQAKMDADIACIGTQYLASDLRSGLVLTARGDNAADALNKACNSNGIPVELGMRKGTEGWVVHLFNVGDEQQPDGTWKYWVQYHDGKYNDWTLGHYTEGGYFELIYTITAEVPLAKTGLHYTGNDIEGVPGGPGYTVVGGIAKDVGTYTATATLTDSEYMWTDGTVEPKIIVWHILDNGSDPDNPDVPEVPSEHLDPDDQGVVVEHDSKTNDDGTVTEITTVIKTDESGNEVTTTISTTTYEDGTTEEIRSTPNTEVSNGVKTESILETVTIKDGNGSIVSETNITVSIVDNTTSNAESKGITIHASDENGNVTVSANAIEESTSAIVVTDIKAAESNGQLEISDEALELALKMQGLYSKKILEYSESVDTSEKVIQVKTDSSEAQVSLDSEAMKKVSDSNAAFRMSTSKGSITVEKDTLSGLSQREEVTLSFSPADRSSMTSAQREVIEVGSTVVNLTASSGGQSIGRDLGGKVIVTVKHAAVDGKTPVAYYVDGDGNRTRVAEQHYDAEKEEMTMVLDHFSIYTIVDESPAGEEIPVAVLVMTAVIVLICLGILLPQMVGRKQ